MTKKNPESRRHLINFSFESCPRQTSEIAGKTQDLYGRPVDLFYFRVHSSRIHPSYFVIQITRVVTTICISWNECVAHPNDHLPASTLPFVMMYDFAELLWWCNCMENSEDRSQLWKPQRLVRTDVRTWWKSWSGSVAEVHCLTLLLFFLICRKCDLTGGIS